MDWEQQFLLFVTETGKVTLQGDVEMLQITENSTSDTSILDWDGNTIKLFFSKSDNIKLPRAVETVLETYNEVFTEPKG